MQIHVPKILKLTLDLVLISSLVFKPWGELNVPSLQIHLSSVSFSLWHSEHLHPMPPECPAFSSCCTDVSMWSIRFHTKCETLPDVMCSGHPCLKCLYRPVLSLFLPWQAVLVPDHLLQTSLVLPMISKISLTQSCYHFEDLVFRLPNIVFKIWWV